MERKVLKTKLQRQ